MPNSNYNKAAEDKFTRKQLRAIIENADPTSIEKDVAQAAYEQRGDIAKYLQRLYNDTRYGSPIAVFIGKVAYEQYFLNHYDEITTICRAWNTQRNGYIRMSLTNLIPSFVHFGIEQAVLSVAEKLNISIEKSGATTQKTNITKRQRQ